MKRHVLTILAALIICMYCGTAVADLYDRGGGLIYDSDLNITWYDFTYRDPLLTPLTGATWDRAMAWAAALDVNGITGWRLPTTPGTSDSNHSEGEMGHLYYVDMIRANSGGSILPFHNIMSGTYWYGTESSSSRAWDFNFGGGIQDEYYKIDHYYYALAVHPGDVGAPVPIPAALWLLGAGLLGLIGMKRKMK